MLSWDVTDVKILGAVLRGYDFINKGNERIKNPLEFVIEIVKLMSPNFIAEN
jgi:hypothetical protein